MAAYRRYFIQLEDRISPESVAGDLWLLDSDESVSACHTTDMCFTVKRCSLDLPENEWEPVSFLEDSTQCFSEIDQVHFYLLLGVTTASTRFDLFMHKQWLLTSAAKLTAGCRVGVRVKNDDSVYEVLTGVIRYAARLRSNSADFLFGIELDPEFEGRGTSNGEFKKHKYFECKDDCAVFVSIDKLQLLQSDLSSYSDSTEQSTNSSSGRLLTGRSVAEMVQTCALAISDRVVWMSDDGPEHGTVRWIGVLPDAAPPEDASQLTVGVEFDNPVGSGTGRYHSQTLFMARRHHASLIPIMGLMKESDLGGFSSSQQLPSAVCADSEPSVTHPLPDVMTDNQAAQLLQSECHSGAAAVQLDNISPRLSSVDHKGCVQPPSVADADMVCGVNRGIQSYSNTCTLEVIIFVMFAFCSYFDKQLFATPTDNLIGEVKSILVEQIVNPLRASYFVSCEKMRRFGDLFTMIQSAKLTGCATSNITLSDDPCGTITTVLCDLLQVDPLIVMSNSRGYVYNVDISQTSYPFPSLQHVIECSVVKNPKSRLVQYPQSVFIVSVDSACFGKLVTCGRIFPGLILDISGIMHFAVHLCRQCGQQGLRICGSCFTDENMREVTDAYKLSDYVFCDDCFDRSHRPVNRQDHHTLPISTAVNNSPQELQAQSMLELFAVVSSINRRYVSFFKVGAGDSAAWLTYDGMAAVGQSSRHNSQVVFPEIKRCHEIETWLKDVPAAQRADTLPDVIVKLTSGLRLCFYRPIRP